MNPNIKKVIEQIQPLRDELKNHELYRSLNSIEDIKVFMESHVYAVWDFMSLLKGLQIKLTCTQVPWKPNSDSKSARLINQIIVDEESDLNFNGEPKSHFEMYLEAMNEIKADIKPIEEFCKEVNDLDSVDEHISNSSISPEIKSFLKFSFNTIKGWKAHEIAAAFTFGREEIIPDMFLQIIKKTEQSKKISLNKINYYLQRHIDLDGDEHGPLAHEMISSLCQNDAEKWKEVIKISKEALKHRISLWSYINNAIKSNIRLEEKKVLQYANH